MWAMQAGVLLRRGMSGRFLPAGRKACSSLEVGTRVVFVTGFLLHSFPLHPEHSRWE